MPRLGNMPSKRRQQRAEATTEREAEHSAKVARDVKRLKAAERKREAEHGEAQAS